MMDDPFRPGFPLQRCCIKCSHTPTGMVLPGFPLQRCCIKCSPTRLPECVLVSSTNKCIGDAPTPDVVDKTFKKEMNAL